MQPTSVAYRAAVLTASLSKMAARYWPHSGRMGQNDSQIHWVVHGRLIRLCGAGKRGTTFAMAIQRSTARPNRLRTFERRDRTAPTTTGVFPPPLDPAPHSEAIGHDGPHDHVVLPRPPEPAPNIGGTG